MNINFKKLFINGTESKVIQNIQKSYEDHLNSVRERKNLIIEKIESKIESITNRSNLSSHKVRSFSQHFPSSENSRIKNETEVAIRDIMKLKNEWVEIMKSISKVSELKKVYEKGIKEIQNSSGQMNQNTICII